MSDAFCLLYFDGTNWRRFEKDTLAGIDPSTLKVMKMGPTREDEYLAERDEARCIARWFDGWTMYHAPWLCQHIDAWIDRDALDWLNWPDEKSYLRPTPVYEEGARVWDRGRVCECRDGQLVPVEDGA